MNNKASTSDALFAVVILVILTIAFTIGHAIINQADQSGVYDSNNASEEIIDQGVNFYTTVPDNIIIGTFFGSIIVSAILAFLFNQHVITKVIGVIVDMFLLLGGVIVQIWWESYKIQPGISNLLVHYPKTSFLLDHIILAQVLGILIITIALFANGGRDRGF